MDWEMPDVPAGVDPSEYMEFEMKADGIFDLHSTPHFEQGHCVCTCAKCFDSGMCLCVGCFCQSTDVYCWSFSRH